MKFSPGIQKLVDQAERQHRTRRRRTAAGATPAWSESAVVRRGRQERESRAGARGRLELLRYQLRKAREQSRQEVAAIRARARASRPALRASVAKFRAKWRAWVNARVAEFRVKHRAVWSKRVETARARVYRAEQELQAELGIQRDLRRALAAERAARRPTSQATGAVHRAESDQAVENNLEPDLVPVWRSVRRRIRTAGPYRSRTEAFLEWVHDNPAEVATIRSRHEARAGRELERELAEQEARYYREQAYA